jgi:filamentous hemagglutinin family protein
MDPRLSERDVPLPGFAFQRQRFFTDAQINAAVDGALARVQDPTKRTVILRGQVDEEGAALVFVVRPNGVWTVSTIVGYEKSQGWGAGFEIKAEF